MPDDDTIAVLPPQVANQIAAGEVIERPASVVKELLENALDARATRVELNIAQGGRTLVEISDNGAGMTRANARAAFQRQATSKLRGIHDLQELATLGFRGEALPSIASVSRVTLRTCREGEALGTELDIHAGVMDGPRDAARPHGATFTVRDLFFNVPARKKFLRAVPTEQGHIKQAVVGHALAHPEVAFLLRADGREILRAPAAEKLLDRVADLFSPAFARELRPFAARDLEASAHGFMAPPHMAARGEAEYYIFVNSRPASAPVIFQAIRQALPDPSRKPALFLFIELDPSLVDVNVHPAKREVRFKNPLAIRDLVTRALMRSEELGVRNEELGIGNCKTGDRKEETRIKQEVLDDDMTSTAQAVFHPPVSCLLSPVSSSQLPTPNSSLLIPNSPLPPQPSA
ncbi:MAG: DNA mismatch repair endonuclease MutL, partial [Kiritimatiellaeota bacterium]|nr:DNA mismatch repair endonuclease MutL [Kiritimatiellota bacterium]